MRRADGWSGPWAPGPPWARRRLQPHGRHGGGPPVAVISAILFHVLGARDLAADGLVHRPMDALTYTLLLIGPLALFWRGRFPVAVFAVAATASIAFATQAQPRWTYAVAPAIALFGLARQGRRAAAVLAAVSGFGAYLLVMLVLSGPVPVLDLPAGARPDLRQIVLGGLALVAMVLLGAGSRVYANQLAEIAKARAEQERVRQEQQKRQASEERLRIARELHDVLGHHLSLINVQAGVGLHLMDARPEQAREALAAIKTASSEALREVRSVLGVLRTEGEEAPRQPALGLGMLSELTADAGIPVRTTITGEPRELPAEVDRAAYRIVQEALTNVRRHAPAGSAVGATGGGAEPGTEVSVNYLPAALHLSIRNAGPPPDPGRPVGEPGSGIIGMRARAETLGGTLAAGRPPTGGFLVSVVLPLPPQSPRAREEPHTQGPEETT
ncbi:sensor histidine kinase [Actinoplanes sp. NBRC 101535]|uniref:sensor histidine kinase n=1 Tax=Actinoplanes sp. NBRC 101535 TaxID=3032196 RepID=UPI0024A2A437|nr:sensor histidine kinase [Actinoplanes sp. NBRC 101535]GLY07428.1 two-component sensor histidine kinase [Actinoplanes sp. NBRC 101535]